MPSALAFSWWSWIIVGLGLLGLEIITPGGFVLVFFGAAGIVVGLLSAVFSSLEPWVQWAMFSLFSVMGLLFLRKPLLARFFSTHVQKASNDLIGEVVILDTSLAPGDESIATLRGTTWRVRNATNRTLDKGVRWHVSGVEGLTLLIDQSPPER